MSNRRASRTRSTIERHVPLAAGRPLRPTDSHFFIFPPNVATAAVFQYSQKSPIETRTVKGGKRATACGRRRPSPVQPFRNQNGRTEQGPGPRTSPPLIAGLGRRAACVGL
ncbi:hypothetical protein ACJJTC_018099 [Scirpophaga incertulas]